MKKVIVKNREDVVDITQININRYYGIRLTDISKGFITREKYDDGDFIPVSVDNLTNGNAFCVCRSPRITTTIKTLIEQGFDVYEFNTHKELFQWLSE